MAGKSPYIVFIVLSCLLTSCTDYTTEPISVTATAQMRAIQDGEYHSYLRVEGLDSRNEPIAVNILQGLLKDHYGELVIKPGMKIIVKYDRAHDNFCKSVATPLLSPLQAESSGN